MEPVRDQGDSPTYNVLLDHKIILNPDAIDKSENQHRDISLSEQHNQIISHRQRETKSISYCLASVLVWWWAKKICTIVDVQ